jgi:hypothetical protein
MTFIFIHHWSKFLPSSIGRFAGKNFEELAMVIHKERN